MNQNHLTPEQQATIQELNDLAKRLANVPKPSRNPAAVKAGLARVRTAGRQSQDRHSRWRLFATPAVAFAALALLFIIAGSALPGQKLYALKRTTENVRDSLTFSTVGKAENCSQFMQTRAKEFAALSKDKKRLPESTVTTLVNDILQEAKEFEEYIAQTPTDQQPRLRTLRQSDAAAVASILIKIDNSTIPDNQQQTVKDSITTLRRIADG